MRDLAIYVNASAQRRHRFMEIQTRSRPLVLIQDVQTRWNSTFNMLVRAQFLRVDITQFIEGESKIQNLSSEEWKHVDYLIEILYPFCVYTNAIGRILNGPTCQEVFRIYHKLFNHLDDQIEKLRRKRVLWKTELHAALTKGRTKLSIYYERTQGNLGNIYGVATILAPEYKLKLFEEEEWKDGDWVKISIITMIIAKAN